MTRNEWAEIVKKIRAMFPQSSFMNDQEVFDVWFEMLEDLEFPATMRSVENYAKENQYPPTIADIRQGYKVLWDGYKAFVNNCKDVFCLATSYYPGMNMKLENEQFEVFLGWLKKFPQKEWMAKTYKFKEKAIAYVKDCEINHKDPMDFKDYLNEQIM